MPSKPRDSIRTGSPTSKVLPVRLTDLPKVSDERLGGRATEEVNETSDTLERPTPTEDDVDATDGERPATDLRPD